MEVQKIDIIYASASGNVESVAEKVSSILKEENIEVQLHRAETFDYSILKEGRVFIFAASTWKHGVISPYFNELVKEMKSESSDAYSSKLAGFIGLGDTRYEPVFFCQGTIGLKELYEDKGGNYIGTVLKINGSPYKVLDTIVVDWTRKLLDELKNFKYSNLKTGNRNKVEELEERDGAENIKELNR